MSDFPDALSEAVAPDAPSTSFERLRELFDRLFEIPPDLREEEIARATPDAVLLKALRKEPASRYATAAAMADDLRRVLAQQPVSARRGGWRYRAGKLVRRHRRGAAATALGLALALGLVAIPTVRQRWLEGPAAARPEDEMAINRKAAAVDGKTRRWLLAGAEQLAQYDAAAARDNFRKAVVAAAGTSPGAALAWDGLARAQSALGEVGRAAEAAAQAAAHLGRNAKDLPPAETERLRARGLAVDGQWKKGIPALEGAFLRLPGRVDVGLDLVAALLAAGRSDAAADALGRLRQLPGQLSPETADPRIDLAEAEVALRRSEFQRAAAAAMRVRERAKELGATALDRARAYLEQTRGNLDLARRSYTSALEKARRAKVPLVIANYLADLSWVELDADRPTEAANRANEAIAIFQNAGDPRNATNTEAVLAWVDARRGDAASARRRLAALRSAAAKEDSDSSRFTFLSVEALIAEVLGDWRHAAEVRRETIRIATGWKTTGLLVNQQLGLARALHAMGNRVELEKLTSDLLPQAERLGLHGVARDLRALLAAPVKKG